MTESPASDEALILGPPETIDAATRAFCATISPAEPVYVPVHPEPWAKFIHCFENSETQAARHGGAAAYGWAIWRWPGRYFEAEHHAVWQAPDGSLTDITPQTGNPPRILFLPDPDAVYDPGTFRRNIVAAEAGNAAAAEYLALAATRRDITDRYWKPGMLILPLFDPEDQRRIAPIDARMADLLAILRAG